MSLLLGPEILDNIFSLLQRDHVTLKSCSQASSGFSLLVEPHLYAQVIIYNRNINGLVTFTAFSKLLLNNPRIASHVRSLTIMFRQKYRSQSPLNDDVISTILPKLIKLKMITLNSSGVRYTSVSWSRLCETFRVAFEDCLQLPSMREVAFEDILGFPLSILEQCRTMKRLLLRGIYFPTNSDSESRSRLGCPELDSLLISYCNHLSEITTWVNISDLRSLYFQPRAIDDFRELSQLLERCADSLNQLEIDLLRMFGTKYNVFTRQTMSTPNSLPPNLSILPHLEQLTVRASISCFHDRQFYRRVRGYESESESLFCESPLTTILNPRNRSPS